VYAAGGAVCLEPTAAVVTCVRCEGLFCGLPSAHGEPSVQGRSGRTLGRCSTLSSTDSAALRGTLVLVSDRAAGAA
jgi:hypothetical protein